MAGYFYIDLRYNTSFWNLGNLCYAYVKFYGSSSSPFEVISVLAHKYNVSEKCKSK